MSWMRSPNKKEEFTPGIVTVIHTFGRDLKWIKVISMNHLVFHAKNVDE